MKKIVQKIALIIIMATLYIIINNIKVQAASVSLTATTKEPTEGQSVTVTANVTAGAWNLKLSGAGKSETVYGYTQSASNSSDSKSITFTAGTAGTTYTFSLTGDMTDINSNNSEPVNESISITVKSKDTVNAGNSGNSNTATPPATEKSTEARLSNLGITPNDFSGFKRDTYNYTQEVPNSVSEVTVYADKVDSKATVTGTGKVSLQEGNNTVKVTVTAEAGNTKTYTLTIKRRTAEEDATLTAETTSNADLKNLGIKPEEYDFSGFQKDITEYVAEVPSDVDEIEVYAEAVNSKAQINGIGNISLKEGKNEIKVEVIAEDGTTKTYTIEVTRGELNEETTTTTTSKFGLSKLTISGLTLNPSFKVGTYEYTVELNEDLTSLDIETIATDEKANIEIAGNENLQEGENIITILVSNKDTNETATYQITVNKNLSSQPETMSWLKPSTWGKEEIIKLIIVAVLILLIISAIILKIKISKEGKNDEDVDLPGAEELDKAMAEHQELSENPEKLEDQSNINQENRNTSEDTNYLEEIAKNNGIEFTEDNKGKRKGKHF